MKLRSCILFFLLVAFSASAITVRKAEWRTVMELTPGSHQLQVAVLHPGGFYTAWATNAFTNSLAQQTTAIGRDQDGNIIWHNPAGSTSLTQELWWDAKHRLGQMMQWDPQGNGYFWTAVYDGLDRRLATQDYVMINGVADILNPIGSVTNQSFYDPQVEFLELGVSSGNNLEWKLYGPDLNGVYGGMNGVGGLEAVSPILNLFEPTISDFRGNILGVVANSGVTWNPARPTGYGAVPGYLPLPLANGADISLASAWRGRWADITGFYSIGLRPYDPASGRWLTYDSVWNEIDPSGMTFAGGDPINRFDADGRISSSIYNEAVSDTSSLFSYTMWGGMADTTYNLGARTVNGVVQAGEIGSDMIGSGSAGIYDWAFDTDVQANYQGYSQLYQNIYNNPSSGPTSGQILSGTGSAELNIATLGLYNMGQGIGTAAATGDYTQLQDASLTSLLLATGTRAMQNQGYNQLTAGYVQNATDQALISYPFGNGGQAVDNVPASTPVGASGSPLTVQPGANAPTTINGIDYTGHALDSMQSRGIPPSVVQNTIQQGISAPGNTPLATTYYDPVNDVTVVTDTGSGRVITVHQGAP